MNAALIFRVWEKKWDIPELLIRFKPPFHPTLVPMFSRVPDDEIL